ncbi:DUF2958 domain-containing protein [Dactylosporangium sucinum]|uniref:DUF2958 domain-containing protein n=1 Tax=Dactylosporangium sucinum TaxID=1424081 RepID=A0A917UJC8_9ACTN|nr:DUF2958 domain-containing protein [Dactylosporangium sucinum]GGM90074.1 hypothetical protein GCM10007977_110170 [Dactylosporangium sucinum]
MSMRTTDPAFDLMPREIREAIPALYAQDGKGDEATVYVKFFLPATSWTWYATEFDPEDGIFFGLVVGHETELGNFALAELQQVSRYSGAILVERDLYFTPKTLAEVRRELAGQR